MCSKYYNRYKDLYNGLVDLIGFIDLNTNISKLSKENVYSKPEIIDSDKSLFIVRM